MNAARDRRVPGWILAETVLAIAILLLLVPTLGTLMAGASRIAARIAEDLERNARAAAAESAVLRLSRDGHATEQIIAELAPLFPEMDFRIEGAMIVIEETDGDKEAAP